MTYCVSTGARSLKDIKNELTEGCVSPQNKIYFQKKLSLGVRFLTTINKTLYTWK